MSQENMRSCEDSLRSTTIVRTSEDEGYFDLVDALDRLHLGHVPRGKS